MQTLHELFKDNKVPKIPKAIEYLRHLQSSLRSAQLSQFLLTFETPKSIDLTTFSEGIKQFIKIANLTPQERVTFYGNAFAGLHYNNDLTHLWNSRDNERIQAHQLNNIAPSNWNSIHQNESCILIYKGHQPSVALDKLVQGPTVIDCGMFCQLSVWFGIRYMLGDARFNHIFGRTPLYITQLNYRSIEHIANSSQYQMKHPGGNYGGENCIVMDGTYHIFDPHLKNKQGLTKQDVNRLLLNVFNEAPTERDADRLALLEQNKDEMHPQLGISYGMMVIMAEAFKDLRLTQEEFSQEKRDSLTLHFDLQKFQLFLQQVDKTQQFHSTRYVALPDNALTVPSLLLQQIPFENRMTMSFSKYEQKTGMPGPVYEALRPIEKAWLHTYECGGMYTINSWGKTDYEKPWTNIGVNKFEKTSCKTIVLEIGEMDFGRFCGGKRIDPDSIRQLLRVLNYAHDQGGRRVILINLTRFDAETLIQKIKQALPSTQCERTWSRLTCLLSETATTIFQYTEFNDRIPEAPIENTPSLVQQSSKELTSHLTFKFKRTTVSLGAKLERFGLHKHMTRKEEIERDEDLSFLTADIDDLSPVRSYATSSSHK